MSEFVIIEKRRKVKYDEILIDEFQIQLFRYLTPSSIELRTDFVAMPFKIGCKQMLWTDIVELKHRFSIQVFEIL